MKRGKLYTKKIYFKKKKIINSSDIFSFCVSKLLFRKTVVFRKISVYLVKP